MELGIGEQLFWLADQKEKQQCKIRACQNHKQHRHILDNFAVDPRQRLKMSEAGVVSAESAGRHRRKRVTDRVVNRHAQGKIDDNQN